MKRSLQQIGKTSNDLNSQQIKRINSENRLEENNSNSNSSSTTSTSSNNLNNNTTTTTNIINLPTITTTTPLPTIITSTINSSFYLIHQNKELERELKRRKDKINELEEKSLYYDGQIHKIEEFIGFMDRVWNQVRNILYYFF